MKFSYIKSSIGIAVSSLLITGCSPCLTKAKIAGEVSAVESGGSIGKIAPDIEFTFKDCCPTKEKRKSVREIEKLSFKLATLYTSDKMDKNTYSEKQSEMMKLLKEVKLVCPAGSSSTSAAPSNIDVWKRIDDYVANAESTPQ